MPAMEVFDFVCAQLESRTSLDRLAARGTVRIALKQAGLDAQAVTPEQMAVVVEKLLPAELVNRSVPEASSLCEALALRTRTLSGGVAQDTPDAVFRRLGGAE